MSGWCGRLVTTATPAVVGSSTITASPPFMALDYAIEIAWESKDLDLFTPASAPLLQDRATSLANKTTSSHVSEQMSSAATSSPALSSGVIAAIATSSICGLLLILLLTFLLARVRKHHLRRKEPAANDEALDDFLNPICEASHETKPAEADSSNARVELDGDWHGYEVEATAMLSSRSAG